MTTQEVHICAFITVYNDAGQIDKALSSIKSVVNSIVVCDLGSTDDTMDKIDIFCKTEKIMMHMLKADFTTHINDLRNQGIDYINQQEEIDYILFIDPHQELTNGREIRKTAIEYLSKPEHIFIINQQWMTCNYTKEYILGLLKTKTKLKYLSTTSNIPTREIDPLREQEKGILIDNCTVYQDSNTDPKKYRKMIHNHELLVNEHKKHPRDPRVIFHLAELYEEDEDFTRAIEFYQLRLIYEGYSEEKYLSFYRLGNILINRSQAREGLAYLYEAMEYGTNRIEAIIKLAQYYRQQHRWLLAFTYSQLACKLSDNVTSLIFIDKEMYNYTRWNELAMSAYQLGAYKDGKIASEQLLKHSRNQAKDETILQEFIKKISEIDKMVKK
jgi:5S rRNA maturation endonuclease (ribonuclease M5)